MEHFEELLRLAEQGDAKAQYNLGVMYRKGHGVPQNDAEAVKWYRKSAEQGDAHAQFNLGFMYNNGKGVPQNDAEAAKWYRKAAKQGDAEAKSLLKELESDAQSNLGVDTAAANKFHADTARANELFVEAAKLLMKSQDATTKNLALDWLEKGFQGLTKIIDDYSSTDLAVKLISGQSVGGISLESYGEDMSHWEKYERAKEDVPILDEAIKSLGLDKLL